MIGGEVSERVQHSVSNDSQMSVTKRHYHIYAYSNIQARGKSQSKYIGIVPLLAAFRVPGPARHLAMGCIGTAKALDDQNNTGTAQWVPGHFGVVVNEYAKKSALMR